MKRLTAFFAGHGVAANILMAALLAGGLLTLPDVKQEVFPEIDSGIITVTVEYRGATPVEVEEGVCIRIEEAVQGIEGVKRVTSRAVQNVGVVSIEVLTGEDVRVVLDDVKTAVDAIDTFPDETEQPVVSEFETLRQVINVAVHGQAGERVLRQLAERVRDELSARPEITQVSLSNVRPYEISIEVSEDDLRRHGLSIDQVSTAVKRASLDLPGGSVKTLGGEILLRAKGQAYVRRDFEDLVVWTRADGSRLLLSDVAEVIDAFEDTGLSSRFDGEPTAMVQVYRVGDQSALDIADAVVEWCEGAQDAMPPGITLTPWQNDASILRSRVDLLVRNGRTGLLLVFVCLAMFLRLKLAFWVTMGIPIAFLGAVWMMPLLDVSISLISLFGFIVALGIVVDDAIVAGESIYTTYEDGASGLDAAVRGVGKVAVPVVFAVLTTVAAFTPLLGVESRLGSFMGVIPKIVIPVLLLSLVESLLILPHHLSHLRHDVVRKAARFSPLRLWEHVQGVVTGGLRWFVQKVYAPVLDRALAWRYASAALGIATLAVTLSLFVSGRVQFFFFPPVEADNVVALLTLPSGTTEETTREQIERIVAAADEVEQQLRDEGLGGAFRHVLASVGNQPFRADQSRGNGQLAPAADRHLGEVNIELVPAEERGIGSQAIASRWRVATGSIPDAVELMFTTNLFSTGEDINIELVSEDIDGLRSVATGLKQSLTAYPGVNDITDTFREGKREVRLDITHEAEASGLRLADLARQVRQGFFGDEVQRIQRGRDDVRVMVRYPDAERRSLGDLEAMRVRLPDGAEVPFETVATATLDRSEAVIQRADRRRSLNVTASVDPELGNPDEIIAELEATVLPRLFADNPGVSYRLEGQKRQQEETNQGLFRGFLIALVLIYGLLAIPFRSYLQPLVVMLAIPFGIVGAIWGHMLNGMDLTILSLFGMVALTGVLVNDSLVMVDWVNTERARGTPLDEALRHAGRVRFRPILLTSLTTFLGLFPLLLEKSLQAQFLIPMAVSLAYGVMFATFITLLLVPVGYRILEDVRGLAGLTSRPDPGPR